MRGKVKNKDSSYSTPGDPFDHDHESANTTREASLTVTAVRKSTARTKRRAGKARKYREQS